MVNELQIFRVSSDLKMSGNFDARRKSQGKVKTQDCVASSRSVRSKTRSSRKTRKPRRISFPRFSTPSFPFCTVPKTEKSELKTSEICSEVVSSNSEVLWSNSEVFQLRLFHFALHSKRKTRR